VYSPPQFALATQLHAPFSAPRAPLS
jgi:hypothetical protein